VSGALRTGCARNDAAAGTGNSDRPADVASFSYRQVCLPAANAEIHPAKLPRFRFPSS